MSTSPIVGIVLKRGAFGIYTPNETTQRYFDDRLISAVRENGATPIGIMPSLTTTLSTIEKHPDKAYGLQIEPSLGLCQGFILQDGNEIHEYESAIALYAYRNDIPILGIGVGASIMQKAISVDNYSHRSQLAKNGNPEALYYAALAEDSMLSSIIQKRSIVVRYAHSFTPLSHPGCNLRIAAKDSQSHIVALESPDKKFYLGVQFRPELTYDQNPDVNKIFEAFVSALH